VKLGTELRTQPNDDVSIRDEITDLQQYAATVRLIYARAKRLRLIVVPWVPVPPQLNHPEENIVVQGGTGAAIRGCPKEIYAVRAPPKELKEKEAKEWTAYGTSVPAKRASQDARREPRVRLNPFPDSKAPNGSISA
jgi:hypothetical protein